MNSQQQQQQQQQQQPKSTAELIRLIVEDYKSLVEAAGSDDAQKQVDANAVALAETVRLNADIDLDKYSKALPSSSHVSATPKILFSYLPKGACMPSGGSGSADSSPPPPPKSAAMKELETHFRELMLASLHAQKAYAACIVTFLEEFPVPAHGDEDVLDSDGDSGYYAGNLMVFNETLKKVLEQHTKSLAQIHEAVGAVLHNASVDIKLAKARSQRGEVFLIRHRSKCSNPNCTSPFKEKGEPAIARSLLQGVPLCATCIKIEEKAIKAPLSKRVCK